MDYRTTAPLIIACLSALVGCGSHYVPPPPSGDAGPPMFEDAGPAGACGDGVIAPGEECDDGAALNVGGYGGCNPDCTIAAFCGDGRAGGDEECDLGESANDGAYGSCNPDCTAAPSCGDGAVDPGEACDEGPDNHDVMSSCSTSCQATGLLAHLDARDPHGTGARPVDGFVIDAWWNHAGPAAATQADSSARPRFREGALGGMPALEFDGVDDRLTLPVDIDSTSRPEVTVAVVFQNRPGDPNPYAGVWGQDDGGWDRFMSTGGTAGISNGGGYSAVDGITDTGRPIVAVTTLRSTVADSSVHVNGELAATFTERHTNSGDRSMSIGSLNGPSLAPYGYAFDGYIAEVLVYGAALTDAQRMDLEDALLERYASTRPAGVIHEWTFDDGTARDSAGTAHGSLRGGARIEGGALQLDGVDDYMRSAALEGDVTARTLVAWVRLDNLDQKAGGALTLEQPEGTDVFDAIVFGENADRQWMGGSDFSRRTLRPDNGGARETSTGWRMIAIAYDVENGITIYRDGVRYADRHVQGTVVTYPAGRSDVLLGVRHEDVAGGSGTVSGGDGFLAGEIDRAMIYGRALDAGEVAELYAAGP